MARGLALCVPMLSHSPFVTWLLNFSDRRTSSFCLVCKIWCLAYLGLEMDDE